MIGTCEICEEQDVTVDDDGYCENCANEYMYKEAQKKAIFDEDIKTILEGNEEKQAVAKLADANL